MSCFSVHLGLVVIKLCLVKDNVFQLYCKSLVFPTPGVLHPYSLGVSHLPFFYPSFDISFCFPSPSAGGLQSFGKTHIIWGSSEILLPHRLYVSEVIPLVKDGEMEVPLWPPNLAVGWRACGAARNDAWCLQHLQILTAFSSMMRTKSLTSTLMPVWGEVLGCALELCSKKENSVAGKKPTLFLANAAAVVLFPSEERAVHQGNFTLLPRGADKSSMSRHFLLLYLAGLWDWE